MSLELQPCTEADMARFFALISHTFGQAQEYINAIFPAHSSPAGRAAGATRFLAMKREDPVASFVKVVDTSVTHDDGSNEILGVAKWNVYRDGNVPEEGELAPLDAEWWDEDVDGLGGSARERGDYARWLYREFLVERRRAIRESGGNLVSLDLLVTDPAHQRRGVGRLLVGYGTRIADEMGVRAVVEASPEGRPLYEKCGFRFKYAAFVEKNVPEVFSARPKQEYLWMVRPSKNEREAEEKATA